MRAVLCPMDLRGDCFEGERLEVSGDGGAGLEVGGVAVDACQDDGRGFLRLVTRDSNRKVIVAVSLVEKVLKFVRVESWRLLHAGHSPSSWVRVLF